MNKKSIFILENSGTYKIINKRSGQYYPGSSKHLLKQKDHQGRLNQHLYLLRNNKHRCHHLQNAYNLYGKDNFEFVVIKNNIPENQLLIEEQKLLDIARNEPKKCYTKNYIAGKVDMTPEVRQKISETSIRNGLHLHKGKNNPMYGKKHSLESNNKNRLSHLGKKYSLESIQKSAISRYKIINQFDLNNQFIQTFSSIKSACLFLNIQRPNGIISVCRKRQKTAHGFKWEYV